MKKKQRNKNKKKFVEITLGGRGGIEDLVVKVTLE